MLSSIYNTDFGNPASVTKDFLKRHKGAITCSSKTPTQYRFSDIHVDIGCDKHPKELNKMLKVSFPELHADFEEVALEKNVKKYSEQDKLPTFPSMTTYQHYYGIPEETARPSIEKMVLDFDGEAKKINIDDRLRYLYETDECHPTYIRQLIEGENSSYQKQPNYSIEDTIKNPLITEYNSTISRTGCMINRNKLHADAGYKRQRTYKLIHKCKERRH